MASIRRHPNATTRWQVRYRDPTGRQRTKNFAKRSDAEKYANLVEADKLRGNWTDPALGKMTYSEWSRQYEASRLGLRPSTRARDDSCLRNLILPTFGETKLSAIQPINVRQWIATLVENSYAPATVRKAAQLFRASLDAAVREGLVHRSPALHIELPRIEQRELRVLTPEEIDRVAAASPPRYRVLALTAGYTGLRFGELAGLKESRINLLERSLQVTHNLADVSGVVTIGPVKTPASRRRISLPAFLCDQLGSHLGSFRNESGFVFTSPTGSPLRRTNYRRRVWIPTIEAAFGDHAVRFHDLRHSHAAMLIAEGVHPKVLQERLGHSSIKTTLDTYGHLYEGLDGAAATALDDVYSRSRVDRMWTDTPDKVPSLAF